MSVKKPGPGLRRGARGVPEGAQLRLVRCQRTRGLLAPEICRNRESLSRIVRSIRHGGVPGELYAHDRAKSIRPRRCRDSSELEYAD